MPSDLLKDLEGLRTQAGNTYPELQHLELDGSNDVYPQDVEAEANEWFQKVYHEKLNIEDFVSMLKGWQVCLLSSWWSGRLQVALVQASCLRTTLICHKQLQQMEILVHTAYSRNAQEHA